VPNFLAPADITYSEHSAKPYSGVQPAQAVTNPAGTRFPAQPAV